MPSTKISKTFFKISRTFLLIGLFFKILFLVPNSGWYWFWQVDGWQWAGFSAMLVPFIIVLLYLSGDIYTKKRKTIKTRKDERKKIAKENKIREKERIKQKEKEGDE